MCRFDTGKFRHRDIQHNDVRVKPRRFEKQFLAIGHGTHHLEVGLQQGADPFSDGTMVVGKQYAWPIQYFLRSPSSAADEANTYPPSDRDSEHDATGDVKAGLLGKFLGGTE